MALCLTLLVSGCADPREWFVCGLGACSEALDSRPPGQARGLVANALSQRVVVTWTANTEPDLSSYRVYRGTSAGGPYARVGSVSSTEYSDERVVNDTTYFYVVRAVDRSGNEGRASNEVSATPRAGGGGPTLAFLTKWGSEGNGNGQFSFPQGIATGGNSVYVADTGNHRIQKFNGTGVFVRSWGGQGSGNGQFSFPSGIATDRSGNVYVADTGNDRIQKFTQTGAFVTSWSSGLNRPGGVAVDASGSVYVADTGNDQIQRFTSTGGFITKWGSFGSGNGSFFAPTGIATDAAGNVYVADTNNHRVQKFTPTGSFVATWGRPGEGDGQFDSPAGVAVFADVVYVADRRNNRMQKLSSAGSFVTKWGRRGSSDGEFMAPAGVATDCRGNVYVADTDNHRVQKFGDPAAQPCATQPGPPALVMGDQIPASRAAAPGAPRLVLRSGAQTWQLTFTTSVTVPGTVKNVGRKLAENGARARGTFRATVLRGGSSALPAARFSLGVWHSIFNVVADPRTSKGVASGFTLVTFKDLRGGRLCLSSRITFAAGGSRADLRGSFSTRGGTGAAATLVARGSYRQLLTRRGRLSPLGTGSVRQGKSRPLPKGCRDVKRIFRLR